MIRPIDLQNTILQSMQSAAAVQRVEEGPRLAAQAVQAAFAAELTHRDESVAEVPEVIGNRVGAKSEGGEHAGGDRKRKPAPGADSAVDDEADLLDEPPHLIDFSA